MARKHNHRSLKHSKTQCSPQRTRNRHLVVVYNLQETDSDGRRTAHKPGTQELGSQYVPSATLSYIRVQEGKLLTFYDIYVTAPRSHVRVPSVMGGKGCLKCLFNLSEKGRCSAIICNLKNNNNCHLDKMAYDIRRSDNAFVILHNASVF